MVSVSVDATSNQQAVRHYPAIDLLSPADSGPFHFSLRGGALVFALQNTQILLQHFLNARFRILEVILKSE
jgi:hypothetical protein